jgi:cytoskeletal protein CcmA (bactofilin family)
MNEGKRTLIEEGTELKGTLTSSCPVVVLGRLEGQMTGPSVDVAESGVLSGRAKVKELRSRGELSGEFEADSVELSGRVHDKTVIRAQTLEVKLQRSDGRLEVTFGECELAVGEAPDKATAVREAASGGARPVVAANGGGEVNAEADASPSTRNGRRKRPDDSESHAENA